VNNSPNQFNAWLFIFSSSRNAVKPGTKEDHSTTRPSSPSPGESRRDVVELIANKMLRKYFSTELEACSAPLEVWAVVRRCLEDLSALAGKAPSVRLNPKRSLSPGRDAIQNVEPASWDSGIIVSPVEREELVHLKDIPHHSATAGTHTTAIAGGTDGTAGQSGDGSLNARFGSCQRKRNIRSTDGEDDGSPGDEDSKGNRDRQRPPDGFGAINSKRTKSNEADSNLSCPFRKRNPLRFNIRDHPPCANHSYSGMAQLKWVVSC
jgi:hypothetical protein